MMSGITLQNNNGVTFAALRGAILVAEKSIQLEDNL
jgi:hypothetical protein